MEMLKGSMETLSAMQITADIEGLDIQSKTILRNKEILAVILQGTIKEYKGYSRKEIAEFIEANSITTEKEVSPGRINTQFRGDNAEFIHLNEKTSTFDLAFRAKNPQLSTETIEINLHIDVEPQKTYKPGYPIEKRGMYYLARRLSSQLSLAMEGTDYNQLEKCYGIWLCIDDIPPEDRYSISVYETINTENTALNEVAKENYDLMTLVVIKLGNKVYNGNKEDEGYELLRFLNAIMYPHKEDFMATVSEYIDFSENEELWKEAAHMGSWAEKIHQELKEEMREEVTNEVRNELIEEVRNEVTEKMTNEITEKVTNEVTEKVMNEITEKVTNEVTEKVTNEVTEMVTNRVVEQGIQAVIQDNLEEQVPKERIVNKLQKFFALTEEKSEFYYTKFAGKVF
ncbi:MAG: hypothetical protein HFG81_02650 [Dorea sp.]|jgi:hypothetical protein|nr:hypothetical protein [Dorea sp.]